MSISNSFILTPPYTTFASLTQQVEEVVASLSASPQKRQVDLPTGLSAPSAAVVNQDGAQKNTLPDIQMEEAEIGNKNDNTMVSTAAGEPYRNINLQDIDVRAQDNGGTNSVAVAGDRGESPNPHLSYASELSRPAEHRPMPTTSTPGAFAGVEAAELSTSHPSETARASLESTTSVVAPSVRSHELFLEKPYVNSPNLSLEAEAETMWGQFERTAESFHFFSRDRDSSCAISANDGVGFWRAIQKSSDPLHDAAAGLVRRLGIAPSKRRRLWQCWSGADELRSAFPPETYSKLCANKSSDLDEDSARTILKDVERTRPDEALFLGGKGEGSEALIRILTAFAGRFPELGGYVQGQSSLAAFIFLTFSRFRAANEAPETVEEDSFWAFSALVSNFAGGYFEARMEPLLSDSLILQKVLDLHSGRPAVTRRLQQIEFDWLYVVPDWFVHLFVDSIQDEIAAQLWDIIFWQSGGSSLVSDLQHKAVESRRISESTFMNLSPVLIWVVLGLVEKSSDVLEDPLQCRSFQECIEILRASAENLQSMHELLDCSMSLKEVAAVVSACRSENTERRTATAQQEATRPYSWASLGRFFDRRRSTSGPEPAAPSSSVNY